MANYQKVVKFFFGKAPLDTKYKVVQQKVSSKKAMLTRKMNGLSERLEKYYKQKELTQLEAQYVEATMLVHNNEIDGLLTELRG